MKSYANQFVWTFTIVTIVAAILLIFPAPIWADSPLAAALKEMQVSQKELMATIDLLLAQGQITPEQAQEARLEVSNMDQSAIDRAKGEAVELIGKQNVSPVLTPAPSTATLPSTATSAVAVPSGTALPIPRNSDEQLKDAFQYFNKTP